MESTIQIWVFLHKLKDFKQPVEEGEVLEGRPGLPDDGRNYRVLHVAADSVVLDGNHPYSEIALHYELVVESVKPATKEEIEIQKTAHEMDLYDDEDSLDASDVEEEQSSWDIPQAGDHRLH